MGLHGIRQSLSYLELNRAGDIITGSASYGPFNREMYSRFKYGDGEAVRQYSQELLGLLLKTNMICAAEPLLISGSAYHRVPTAAAALALVLTGDLRGNNFDATYFHINSQPYAGDYGAMDLIARETLLSGNGLHIDQDIVTAMRSCTVIIVDDIRITGMHERRLRSLLLQANVRRVVFCYIATLNQQDGERHPQIESVLNHAYVQNVRDILEIAAQPVFYPNARTCKMLLKASLPELLHFGWRVPVNALRVLLTHMRADGYHAMPANRAAFLCLATVACVRLAGRYF